MGLGQEIRHIGRHFIKGLLASEFFEPGQVVHIRGYSVLGPVELFKMVSEPPEGRIQGYLGVQGRDFHNRLLNNIALAIDIEKLGLNRTVRDCLPGRGGIVGDRRGLLGIKKARLFGLGRGAAAAGVPTAFV